jgi:short-subunit dehydrogenase
MADSSDAQDKQVAVVTGASSGIGRATALEFARRGYNVVVTARRTNELKKVAEACQQEGAETLAMSADTTDEAALERVAQAAVSKFGKFDIWVNDAAVGVFGKFLETPLEDFRRALDTNVLGYVHGSRIALQQFRMLGHGVLINVNSINAVAPVPYASAYVASKFAVRGLTESLRMELRLDGLADKIHVCSVMPATVDTNFFQNAANYTQQEVQALEPVYDPEYVAKNIVKLAAKPKREIIVGPAGRMMIYEHNMMPTLYEKVAGKFAAKNATGKNPAEATSGSLFGPIHENTGMRGGWRERRVRADQFNTAVGIAGAAILGIIGAAYFMSRRSEAKT